MEYTKPEINIICFGSEDVETMDAVATPAPVSTVVGNYSADELNKGMFAGISKIIKANSTATINILDFKTN